MESEVWKDVKGYEGLYQVSSFGRVKSLKKSTSGRVLKPIITRYGYLVLSLCKSGEMTIKRIHRLVAQAFIPNPENKPQVDHINTVRTDNRVENLKWATRSENQNNPITKKRKSDIEVERNKNPDVLKVKSEIMKALYRDEEFKKRIQTAARSQTAKEKWYANSPQVKAVVHYDESGNEIERFKSVNEAVRQTGISSNSIINWCKHRCSPKNNHKWEYLAVVKD